MTYALNLPDKPPFDHADTDSEAAVKAVRLICRKRGPRRVDVLAPDGQLVGIYERASQQGTSHG